jgi:protein-tyrosine phosphatase
MNVTSPLANLRDVAAGLPEGILQPGRLLRADAPYLGDTPPEHVSWPPRLVLDLRHGAELDGDHPLAADAEVHRVPVLAAANPVLVMNLSDMPELATTYLGMLADAGAAALVRAVDVVAGAESPVLVHCAIGKDRTGVVVALILRLLGVEREAVVAEYLKTNTAIEALLDRPALREGRWRDQLRSPDGTISSVIRADRAALDTVMDVWDAHVGGTAGWYLARGGSVEQLQLLERLTTATH